MTKSRTILSTLACLFALVATVAGARRVQAVITNPTPRTQSRGDVLSRQDWLVYVDETWAYVIEYPTDWQAGVAFTNANDRPQTVIRQRVTFSAPTDADVSVDVWAKDASTDLIQWLDLNERAFLELGGVQLPTAPNATIAGQPAVVLSQAASCASPQLFFAYIDGADRVFLVQYTARDAGGALDTYRAMLESISIATVAAPLSKGTDSMPDLPLTVILAATCTYSDNQEGCCGYPQVTHWCCSEDTATKQHLGNCTYWAAYKRPDVGAAVGSGNAAQWAQKAQDAGCAVDATPQAGDIMVAEAINHVAYVTGVSGSTVYVTEMNWCTVCPDRSEDYSSAGKRFIHSCGGDTTPPDGNITNPSAGATITTRSVRLDGWGQDNSGGSGFSHAHFTATWSGVGWHQIGSDFYTSPFGFDWDMCNDGVPDGEVTIGLSLWDQAGNEANPPHAVRKFTKSYNCGSTPTHLQCQNNACVRVDGAGSDQCSSDSDCAPPSGQWQVEYFSQTNLTNRCSGPNYQPGTFVFRDWGDASPVQDSCPSNYWSARFRRTVSFQGGYYTFALFADDWARIWVDGTLVVDKWSPSDQHYEGKNLTAGDHEVVVEFADTEGLAWLTAWWMGPGFNTPREARDPDQWYALYYGFRDPEWGGAPIVMVNEGYGDLNHPWDANGPGYGLPEDRFGSRFQRRVYFDCGTYRFHVFTDDGARLWIDNVVRLSEWRHPQRENFYVNVDLTAGYHELQVDQYDEDGWASISLDWVLQSRCPLNPPSNLTATAVSQSQIDLAWDSAPPDTSVILIERSPTGSNPWWGLDAIDGNLTTFHDTPLGCGSTFYYRLIGYRYVDDRFSDYSNIDSATTFACHTVSMPTTPSGPSTGQTAQTLDYTTDGSTDSQGHGVQYRFDWDDGSYSTWSSSASGAHSWAYEDTYCVRAQARCSTDTTVTSPWSDCKNVAISRGQTGICIPARSLSCWSSHSWSNAGAGSTDEIDTYSCSGWNESGPEYAYEFIPVGPAQVDVSLSDISEDLDIFVVEQSNGLCNRYRCISYGNNSATFSAEAGQTYYLVVDGYYGAASDYTISVNCSVNLPAVAFCPLAMKDSSGCPAPPVEDLSLDPASPSDVGTTVQIHAKAAWNTCFRAMRLLIDGQIVYELGAPEFTWLWNTSGYGAGDHVIRLEVASQRDTTWSNPSVGQTIYVLT